MDSVPLPQWVSHCQAWPLALCCCSPRAEALASLACSRRAGEWHPVMSGRLEPAGPERTPIYFFCLLSLG